MILSAIGAHEGGRQSVFAERYDGLAITLETKADDPQVGSNVVECRFSTFVQVRMSSISLPL